VESAYLNEGMCKLELLQKHESRWQSTDSRKHTETLMLLSDLNALGCSRNRIPNVYIPHLY